jgi:hypothetical protein
MIVKGKVSPYPLTCHLHLTLQHESTYLSRRFGFIGLMNIKEIHVRAGNTGRDRKGRNVRPGLSTVTVSGSFPVAHGQQLSDYGFLWPDHSSLNEKVPLVRSSRMMPRLNEKVPLVRSCPSERKTNDV